MKKMGDIKKSIELNVLFSDTPRELLFIYKNAIKLKFSEQPDYDLYIILFESIIRRFRINGEIKQKKFIREILNNIFHHKNNFLLKEDKQIYFEELFIGYFLKDINDIAHKK